MGQEDIQTKIDVILENLEKLASLKAKTHKEKTEIYTNMSKFRNRIVHLYNHIDTETLYKILTEEFDDIKDFYIHFCCNSGLAKANFFVCILVLSACLPHYRFYISSWR